MGGIAIILLLINMFRGRSDQGGVYSHNFHQHRDLAMAHYGYGGDEEYGAYINRRSFRWLWCVLFVWTKLYDCMDN